LRKAFAAEIPAVYIHCAFFAKPVAALMAGVYGSPVWMVSAISHNDNSFSMLILIHIRPVF
jgi:hypothetical protein